MTRDCIRSPFGSLLDEIRAETVRTAVPAAEQEPRRSAGPEPELHIEAGVVSGAKGRQESPRSWRWAVAIAAHAALLAAILLVPLVMPQDLPAPATGLRAFVVPALVAPPPPPPPAVPAARPAARPAAQTSRRPSPTAAPVAPRVEPEDVIDSAPPTPAQPALTADEGVPGGVEEGVPGGIVGGILEPSSHEDSAHAPAHVRVGGAIREPRKVKNVAPVYPEAATRGKIEGVVLLELSIARDGRVEDVRVLRSIPLLDQAAVAAARQWLFSPTLLSGVPVGVTMTVSVRFGLTQQAAY